MRIAALLVVLASHDLAASPRTEIDKTVTTGRLRKLDLKPTLKAIFPTLQPCYARELARTPRIAGVVNTQLTVRNDPRLGLTLTVEGFDTSGPLGESQTFRACLKTTFEAKVFPPIATRGLRHLTYPGTFATEPPSDRDRAIVDKAVADAKAARWRDALATATRGLELTTLDGPPRRQLIEIGGVAACHLHDEVQARRYYALASPEHEAKLEQACTEAAIDLAN
jgi:hypothetical protein